MYSKTVMQKMISELSVATLVTLARETLSGIGEKSDERTQEAVANVELVVGEIKRRITPAASQDGTPTRRTRKNQTEGDQANE